VSRVNISLEAAEKGGRKVGCPFGGGCYSLSLDTSAWTVEDKTRASARKLVDPDGWGGMSACSVLLQIIRQS